MKITELWKEEMKRTLQMVYNDKLIDEKLDTYLQSYIVKAKEKGEVIVKLRNIYKNERITWNFDDILDKVYENNLIIGANGAFSYHPNDILGDTSIMIIDDLDGRAKEKKLAKDFEKQNMLKEAALHDTLQTKRKQDTNSTYGIACQPGSFLFNPDSASYITTQSRELISEMLWSFERFLANNLCLQDYSEALLYCKAILEEERHYEEYKDWLDFIPTKKDIIKHLLNKFVDVEDFESTTTKLSRSFYMFMDTLTEEDRVYLYYRLNFPALLSKNHKVMEIMQECLKNPEDFLDPNKIPDSYKPITDKLIKVAKEFCYSEFMTTHRVDKYLRNKRDAILLSDTDSVFIILGDLKRMVYDHTPFIESNENNDFKIINTLCTLCTDYIKMRHEKYMNYCNSTNNVFPSYDLNAKNEFYYKRIVIYTGVKKNYSGYRLLREGNILPPKKRIAHTGIKLIASKIPKPVQDFNTNLIENEILKSDYIDPIKINLLISQERQEIIKMLREGDKTLGIPLRYSGWQKYTNYRSNQMCRLAKIWDLLYPNNKIGYGEYMMVFPTKVNTEKDLWRVKDVEMREKIRKLIFGPTIDSNTGKAGDVEPNYIKPHGLSAIGVPKDGDVYKIPDWILDILDYDLMANKHLQSITDLLPSLNIGKTKLPHAAGTKQSQLLSV